LAVFLDFVPLWVARISFTTYSNSGRIYYGNFMKKKKTKKKDNSFKALVLEISKPKPVYPNSMGRGLVQGSDVSAMRDYLDGQKNGK